MLVILLVFTSVIGITETFNLRTGEVIIADLVSYDGSNFVLRGKYAEFEIPMIDVNAVIISGEEAVEHGFKLADGREFPDAKIVSVRNGVFTFQFEGGTVEITDRSIISSFNINSRSLERVTYSDWTTSFIELRDGEKFTGTVNSIKNGLYSFKTEFGSFLESEENIAKIIPMQGTTQRGIVLTNGFIADTVVELENNKAELAIRGGRIHLNNPRYIRGITYLETTLRNPNVSEIHLNENSIYVGTILSVINNELILRKENRTLKFPMNIIMEIKNNFVIKDKEILNVQGVAFLAVPKNMVLVERGSFNMGTPSGGRDNERPVHKVTFTYDYMIGKYEVTFNEYDKFCEETGRSKPNDEGWGRGERPVINVSWFDAIAYCNWLSEKEGLAVAYNSSGNLLEKNGEVTTDITKVEGYRLPTEAEWEYAARGGKKSKGYTYAGSNNIDEAAWYSSNSGRKTQPVGQKLPNELGIYDMSGNVWEWTTCWYSNYTSTEKTNPYVTSGSPRVIRGGSCYYDASHVRIASRDLSSPTIRLNRYGFRLTRTVF